MINISCDYMLSFQRQMIAINGLGLLQHLSIISAPRQQWKMEHKLSDILFLTIVAVNWRRRRVGGNRGFRCRSSLDWLRQHGDFENGVPMHDTIIRVMGMLSVKQLQKSFAVCVNNTPV